MGIEIERKFLVRGRGWRDAVAATTHMVQGYLGGDSCSVRVRIEGAEARLNVKSRVPGMRRTEFEYPVPMPDAEGGSATTTRPALKSGPTLRPT